MPVTLLLIAIMGTAPYFVAAAIVTWHLSLIGCRREPSINGAALGGTGTASGATGEIVTIPLLEDERIPPAETLMLTDLLKQ